MFSPSLATIDDCPFSDLPDDQVFVELSVDILESVLEDIRDCGEKVLFIMDDVVNDMKKEARLEKLLCKVLMNRRHQCGSGGSFSVWITTQVYNKVPAPVRKCASQLVLYETKHRMEADSLYNEVIVGMTKQEWHQLCSYVWDKRFQFIACSLTPQNLSARCITSVSILSRSPPSRTRRCCRQNDLRGCFVLKYEFQYFKESKK